MKCISDPRRLLRTALSSRDAARNHRDQAAGALEEAEAIFASTVSDRDLTRAALVRAEEARAEAMAAAISAGEKPDLDPCAEIKAVRDALVEAESRCRMAKSARDQLAGELNLAQSEVADAEAAVTRAALDVAYAEVTGRCALHKVNAAIKTLVDAYDLINGVARIWLDGHAQPLPPRLAEVAARLAAVNTAVNMLHGERPGLSPPPEEQATHRLQTFMAALANDPEAQLSDVPTPQWTPPKPSSVNIIERDRARADLAWARAVGNTKIAFMG